jgi:hypothetical protein
MVPVERPIVDRGVARILARMAGNPALAAGLALQ